MNKFEEDKNIVTLVLELSRIKMETKEKIKYFSHRFTTLLKNILTTSKPTDEILIKFYTTANLVTIAMSSKRMRKPTLRETFDEFVRVEK